MFVIEKTFKDIAMAHRVASQNLLGLPNKCKSFHGHNYSITWRLYASNKVRIDGNDKVKPSMVLDYNFLSYDVVKSLAKQLGTTILHPKDLDHKIFFNITDEFERRLLHAYLKIHLEIVAKENQKVSQKYQDYLSQVEDTVTKLASYPMPAIVSLPVFIVENVDEGQEVTQDHVYTDEILNGVVIANFEPTAENLAQYLCFELEKVVNGFNLPNVFRIEAIVKETDNTDARFSKELVRF